MWQTERLLERLLRVRVLTALRDAERVFEVFDGVRVVWRGGVHLALCEQGECVHLPERVARVVGRLDALVGEVVCLVVSLYLNVAARDLVAEPGRLDGRLRELQLLLPAAFQSYNHTFTAISSMYSSILCTCWLHICY